MIFLKSKKFQYISAAFLFLIISGLAVFSTDRIFDYDSLYHIRHAWLYKENGLAFSSFPWVQNSVINSFSSDLWYGFHVFLIPFTFFPDLIFAVRLASVFSAAIFLFLFYFLLKKLSVKYPLFFTLLLYFSSGDFLFRINMSRPHAFSFIAVIFLLYLLSQKFSRRTFWLSAFFSFLLSFFHASLFWLAFMVLGPISFFKFLLSEKANPLARFADLSIWRDWLSVFLGLIVGFLLRPHPLGSLKLVYVQIVDLLLAKNAGLPLKFGRELLTLRSADLYFQFLPLAFIFIFSLVIFSYLYSRGKLATLSSEVKIILFSAVSLSVVFLFLSFLVARRSADYFSIFTILSLALIFSVWFREIKTPSLKNLSLALSLVFLLISAARASYVLSAFKKNSEPADKFKEISLWLSANIPPGSIVDNLYWDNFPNLFFWNWQNYYRGGMDPIFQYSFSPALYWKNYFIAYRGTSYTCGLIRCAKDELEDSIRTLKNDFHASYIILEYRRSPNFVKVADDSPDMEKIFSTATEAVYKIN